MIFCKRCGSITINGICSNCSGSNVISHLSPRMPVSLERNFFNPSTEIEKRVNWKTQLKDRKALITKVQSTSPENKGINHNVGKVTSLKNEQYDDPLGFKRTEIKEKDKKARKIIDSADNLLITYPMIQKRMNWQKLIRKNTSVISDLKTYKMPPEVELKEKPRILKKKKDKDTEIYTIKD